MEQKTEPATEYYAFLFEEKEWQQIIDNALAVVYIGELTDNQFDLFSRRCLKELAKKEYMSSVTFIPVQSIPTNKETEIEYLLDEYKRLSDFERLTLYIAVRFADAIRKASGCESKNIIDEYPTEPMNLSKAMRILLGRPTRRRNKTIIQKTENTTESVSQQTEKQGRKARTPHSVIEKAVIEYYYYQLLNRNKMLESKRECFLKKSSIQKKYNTGKAALSKGYGGKLCEAIEKRLHEAPEWDDCKFEDRDEFIDKLNGFIAQIVENAKIKIALKQ